MFEFSFGNTLIGCSYIQLPILKLEFQMPAALNLTYLYGVEQQPWITGMKTETPNVILFFFPFFLILHSTCSWGDNPIDFILAFFSPFFVAVKLDTHLIYCDPLCLGRSYYFPGDYSTKCRWRAAVQKYECVWTEYGTEIEVLTEMHGGSCYSSSGRYLSWKKVRIWYF